MSFTKSFGDFCESVYLLNIKPHVTVDNFDEDIIIDNSYSGIRLDSWRWSNKDSIVANPQLRGHGVNTIILEDETDKHKLCTELYIVNTITDKSRMVSLPEAINIAHALCFADNTMLFIMSAEGTIYFYDITEEHATYDDSFISGLSDVVQVYTAPHVTTSLTKYNTSSSVGYRNGTNHQDGTAIKTGLLLHHQ
jgi:hypothetical protein